MRKSAALALAIFGLVGIAKAGPPLTIDDPVILDPGQWEIIGAVSSARRDSGSFYQLPLLDVSVGLTENTQLSANMPYVLVNPTGEPSKWDFGNLVLGFKWRFVHTENLQVAFAPAYAFGLTASAALLGVGNAENITLLPLDVEYALGNWTLNGEIGYANVDGDRDGWVYGAAIGHPFGERTQLLFELYGAAGRNFEQDSLNYHIGFDFEITPAWHLLVSGGAGLREPDSFDKLDLDLFLGIQHFR
jgi:hypothetical protein